VAPDLQEATAFYEAFGLAVSIEADGLLRLRTYGDPHVWAVIGTGPRKRVAYAAFGAFEDDLERFEQRLDALGVPREPPPATPAGDKRDLWFRDPNGMLLCIRAAPKVMPDSKDTRVSRPCSAGERGAPLRADAPVVRPRRLAHTLFFTPDIDASIAFYTEVLGLRLSDCAGPVAFLHGAHGSDHHLIAFAQSTRSVGYHHSAWDVATINEVGLGAAQMAAAGHDRGWGFGRHVLGSNYFYYVRDPWGSYAEYSFDIDYVPAEMEWPATYPSPENSLHLWGPNPPDDFVINHEEADTMQSRLGRR
jgi:catechol 2,3-dioxygenase-like lactoylglutathione lyase family enzyme